MDGPHITDPHLMRDGSHRDHVPLRVVLDPKVHRPPLDDPEREEYDAGLRIVIHLAMIFSGIFTVAVLTMLGTDIYLMVALQGMIPGAIQEVGDFKLHL